jgi:hypothetical protein
LRWPGTIGPRFGLREGVRIFSPDFSTIIVKPLFLCILLVLLGSCTVYDKVFHPYRIPNPKLSAELKAKMKADKKAKKQAFSRSKKITKPAPDIMTTDAGAAPTEGATASTEKASGELPKKSSVKYNRKGLMKNKTKLKKRNKQPSESIFDKLSHLFSKKKSYGDLNPKSKYKPKKAKFGSPAPDAPDAP